MELVGNAKSIDAHIDGLFQVPGGALSSNEIADVSDGSTLLPRLLPSIKASDRKTFDLKLLLAGCLGFVFGVFGVLMFWDEFQRGKIIIAPLQWAVIALSLGCSPVLIREACCPKRKYHGRIAIVRVRGSGCPSCEKGPLEVYKQKEEQSTMTKVLVFLDVYKKKDGEIIMTKAHCRSCGYDKDYEIARNEALAKRRSKGGNKARMKRPRRKKRPKRASGSNEETDGLLVELSGKTKGKKQSISPKNEKTLELVKFPEIV